jgi:LemA protein
MKNILITLGIIVVVGIGLVSYSNGVYNKAIKYQEEVEESFADIQVDYQRRADLIPGLIATVKGAAENEKEILLGVTNARAGIVGAKTPKDLEIAGRKINSAINLAFEAYPQIRSTANFSEFQAQLEGTENRISVSRKKYNGTVKEFNSHIRGKFRKMAINWFGEEDEFEKKELFQVITEGAEKAPKVEF